MSFGSFTTLLIGFRVDFGLLSAGVRCDFLGIRRIYQGITRNYLLGPPRTSLGILMNYYELFGITANCYTLQGVIMNSLGITGNYHELF